MYKGLRDLAYFAEGHTLRNTLECLHTIFVSLFFSATVLQYKQLKDINFYFSNESCNEKQGIKGVILWTSSFFTEPISFPAFSKVHCYIAFS